MTSFYDQLNAAEPQPEAPAAGGGFYDKLVTQDQEEGRLRVSVDAASKVSPERAAQLKYLSTVTGLPPAVVETNEGEAQARARFQELSEQSRFSPVLRQKLMDPEFTKLAQDDGTTLSGIENGVRVLGGTAGRVAAGMTVEVGATLFDMSAFVNDMISQAATGVSPGVSEYFAGGAAQNREQAKRARESVDFFLPTPTNSTEAGLYSGAQSAGFNLATLPLALEAAAAKGVQAAANVMGAVAATATGTRTYNQGREAGMEPMAATTFAAPAAMAEFLFERWSGGKMLDDIAAKSPVLKMLFNNATREVIGEEATTLTQNFNEWLRLNPEKTVREFINEQPDAMYQTAVAALVGSGIQTGAIKGLQAVTDLQVQRDQATQDAEALKAIFALAAGSHTHERDPQTFAAFVQAAADHHDGAPSAVWIDGVTLAQTLQQAGITNEQIQATLPSVESQLADAIKMNAPVEIPLGELTAAVVGTPLEQSIVEHLRTRPDGLSQAEAVQQQDQAQTFLQQEAQRVIQQAADSVQTLASAQTVKLNFKDQLEGTGRFTKDVSEKYATLLRDFYVVMGERMGKTPEEMYALLPYQISAKPVGGGSAVLNADGTKKGEISVDAYHYSKAERETLSTGAYGTGLKGSGQEMYANAEDTRLGRRLYFYVDKGTGINPESGVGAIAHQARLTNIYDANSDPLRLKGEGGQLGFESRVLDAGFRGYLDRLEGTQSGQVILLGDQMVQPTVLGAVKVENAQVVPAPAARESMGRDTIVDSLQSNRALPAGAPSRGTWAELLKTTMPDEFEALSKAGIFEGDQEERLYKDELIGAFVDATPAETYAQKMPTSTVTLPKKLTVNTALDIRKGERLTGKQAMAVTDVAAYFDKIAGGVRDYNDPKEQARAVKSAVAEVKHQLAQEKSGLDWYDQDVAEAFAETQKLVPELADPKQRQLFSVIAGLQSPGTTARDNWVIAAEAYQHYKKTGVIPGRNPKNGQLWMGGLVSLTKKNALEFLNNLVQDLGEEQAIEWLMGMHTVKELNEARKTWGNMGPGVTGKATDTAMGVVAFGPKVGPFVMNINGIHEITVDVWATRTFNRYFGKALGADGKMADAPSEPERRVVKEIFNEVAKQTGIKPYQVQSVLWFFEQQLYNHLGTGSASYGFSDGARRFTTINGGDTGTVDSVSGAVGNTQASKGGVNGPSATGGEQAQAAGLRKSGRVRGSSGVLEQSSGQDSGAYPALIGLPATVTVDGRQVTFGPVALAHAAAQRYMKQAGLPYSPPTKYAKVDPERAKRIADAFEAMEHAPNDPKVKASYDAMIKETVAQWQAIKATGLTVEFIEGDDPYGNPRNAILDVIENNHLWVYPTSAGFGGTESAEVDITGNPLLQVVEGEEISGRPVQANDIFRIVHDYFGHVMNGVGFRADGEENTWRSHAAMYSDLARPAMTTETRGQNSWVNYGPYAEFNKTANGADTQYAPQKIGLLPEWVMTEGAGDDTPNKYQQKYLAGRDAKALNTEQRAQYDMLGDTLQQGPRGTFDPNTLTTVINENADLSTFLHETGHFFLEAMNTLSMDPNAPAEIKADMAALLKWFGMSQDQWDSYRAEFVTTGKIPDALRAAHERFAESFEQYLLEGKSPNVELNSLFRTFAAWLKRVYTSLEAFMQSKGTQLNDEVRDVMGRMIASAEQIKEAEKVAGMLPDMNATDEAVEKLTARSIRDLKWAVNARSKVIKALQKEAAGLRKTVEDEVRAEVNELPIYKAIRFIKKGELTVDGEEIKATKGHKINTQALTEMYPATALGNPDLELLKGMTASTGLHPDMLADALGFESGDKMVREIIATEPIESVIEGMTDQRMLERHGDLSTPEAIELAATEAVHNEARAKSLATELAAQREQLNARTDTGKTNAKGSRVTVNALIEAAKVFAENVIGKRQIADLKKAAHAHLQAERRAAKAWEAATAKGQTQDAVQAKQDQMLNNYAVRAANEAQRKAAKAMELFKRVLKGNDEKLVERGIDPDIANAARAILAAYGMAPAKGKSALEYLDTVKANDPAMYGVVSGPVMNAMANAKPLYELTVDELMALQDEIESLWHLARRSRQMEVDGDLLDREDVQEQLKARLVDIGIPDKMPGDESAITPKEKGMRMLSTYRAAARRVENWLQSLGSPFTKFVFQPVKEAADRYRADKSAYLNDFRALVSTIEFKRKTIEADELNYTFGKDTGGVAMSELLHAIIHTGNESNKRKLLLGRKWATENPDGTLNTARWDAFIARMVDEGVITKAHYDFAQGVWDLLEKTKPLAQKTHRDVFGRYFAEVTADAFVTPFGTYRGGYAPAIADSRIVADAATRALAEADNESLSYAFPTTNKGFTKGRVEYNRPLLLDLRTLAQHIDKVLLFSHMESPVRDVRKVLTSKTVAYGLNRIDPVAFDNIVTPWLNRAARQSVETPVAGDAGLMRVFSAARSRSGMAAMFANVANAAQQITGFSIAAVKVKPSLMMAATAQMVKEPRAMIKAVSDASIYMKERMENDVANAESALRDILLDPNLLEKGQAWTQKHAYFLQSAVDNSMAPIIWTAAFNQAVAEGKNDKDAVRFADSVIRTTQGSTLPEDVSRIEGGNAFVRMFTQFSGYFNMQANLLGTEFNTVASEVGVKKGAGRMLYVTLLGFLAPAWVGEAIMQAFRGGPDDEDKDGEYLDDWLAAVFGWSTLRGATAMVPGVGQLVNATVNATNNKPYDDRIGSSPAISMIESAVRAPVSVYKAIMDDGNRQKAVRDVATLISMSTGLPANAVAKPLGYLAGVGQNEIRPTSGADAARGAVTGVASPESK